MFKAVLEGIYGFLSSNEFNITIYIFFAYDK